MSALTLSVADLTFRAGEPRLKDLLVGERLGFARPGNVRKIVRRNLSELRSHGEVCSVAEQTSGVGGRPAEQFYLNEAQTLLICMFSRTNAAAEVRRQVVEVFMAYRHGELVRTATPPRNSPAATRPDRTSRWSQMERRIGQIEQALGLQEKVETPAFARALAYVPNVLFLDHEDGRRRRQRRPRWWYDLPVREAGIEHHRQMTIDQAVAAMRHEFGKARAPSRSSLARFWLTLDAVRAAS